MQVVTDEIEDATALRKKEAGEFEDASEEMQQAVTALTKAMVVLDEATKEHAAGVFAGRENAKRILQRQSLRLVLAGAMLLWSGGRNRNPDRDRVSMAGHRLDHTCRSRYTRALAVPMGSQDAPGNKKKKVT